MRNQTQSSSLTPRQAAQRKFNSARSNLALVIVLTLINIALFAFGSDTMMLFSATVPYFAVIFGVVIGEPVFLAVCIAVAVISIGLYVLCWLLSKKRRGWMVAALVFFIIDSLCMVGFYILAEDISGILDVIIHIWVLYYLIVGVRAGAQLKKLPEEDGAAEELVEFGPGAQTSGGTFQPQIAEMDVKFRVLLETEQLGHRICYRKVKRTNELLVDGYVYDRLEMLMETAHVLTANVDGHTIQTGYDGGLHSYIRIDGEIVAKKLRLI